MHRISECQSLGFFQIRRPDQVSATRLIGKGASKLKLPLLPKAIEKGIVRLDY